MLLHAGRIFALVDCNHFYVACERLFRPDLRQAPLVVMSNNDGCAVARSLEARAMGVAEGEPICKLGPLQEGIHLFSSNYTLYGELSRRMMDVLAQFSPRMEIYSIDEAFVEFADLELAVRALPPELDSLGLTDLDGRRKPVSKKWVPSDIDQQAMQLGKYLRTAIYRQLGLPVSVGLGPTRSLAKVASVLAKRNHQTGVASLCEAHRRNQILANFPLAEIWGIGAAGVARMQGHGVHTALDLSQADERIVQQELTRCGLELARELRGQVCVPLNVLPPPRKQVVVARAFRGPVTDYASLRETIVFYTVQAAEKLQKAGRLAGQLSVFLRTDPFQLEVAQYMNAIQIPLVQATADPSLLIRWAVAGLEKIYRPGFAYRKSGVMLGALCDPADVQPDLFADTDPNVRKRRARLQNLMARINRYPGRRRLFYAGSGLGQRAWHPRARYRSPGYMSRWNDVPVVLAN